MADATGVLTRLQAALSTYDPSWDISVGSATYKILESVAQEIANANNNSTLQTYSYDINTKAGNDLDTFCNLFGVYRQLGKRAVGAVTFSTNAPATSIINIPLGTQVAVPVGNNYIVPIYYSTTAPAIIPIGATSISVPVISSLPGVFANVPGNTVSALATTLIGVTGVTNLAPMNNGADPESDSQLRSRWQATAFNNTTGTNGKYILTAYQDPNVTTANAFGTQVFYDEQLTIQATISGGTTNNVTFQMIAYSGMTNVISGTTYTGTNLVAYSGFAASTNSTALASGLQAMISGVAPFNNVTVTCTPSGNTISGGLNVILGAPTPYRLTIGSGTTLYSGTTNSGAITISGTTYTEYVRSLNPDIGASGTQSFNNTFSGYVYPQGNELVGFNLNSAAAVIATPNSDYFYNSNGTTLVGGAFSPQLYIQIANPAYNPSFFIGNTLEVISEYNPAASRSTTITSGNYIDIFINGTTAGLTSEQSVFNINYTLSSGNPVTYLDSNHYVLGSGKIAATNTYTSGDIYIPFDRQPMINFPGQLSTASSGIADTFVLYNTALGSGVTYPIALNPYPYITFTGTVMPMPYSYTDISGNTISGNTISGQMFVNINNANTFLYPGLALVNDGTVLSGQQFYIQSVASSGITLNTTITSSGSSIATFTTSGKALAYPLYDITNSGMNSVHSMTGLAMDTSSFNGQYAGFPTLPNNNNAWVSYQHNYNQDVVDVESLVQQSRPLGVNTLVHQANFQNLIITVRIVFTAGFSLSNVQANISNQLKQYFNNFNYLSIVSFASLQSQILSVAGVSNARITNISTVALDGNILNSYTSDFVLSSNQLPLLNNVLYTIVGTSTF